MHRALPTLFAALALLAAGVRADDGETIPDAEARFIRLVKELRPSVVVVDCWRSVDGKGGEDLRETRASHCGVVLDAAGHVATFGRRVEEATRIEVELVDGRRFPATRVGSDRETGISVLAIAGDPTGLVPVRLGDSDRLEIGSTLVAIGNPFGFKHSVSTGIVSGLDRVIHTGENTFTGMIQTTVPVNPGDAGGLIANSRGECVGLVASTFGRAPAADPIRDLIARMGRDPEIQTKIQRIEKDLLRIQSDPELTPAERIRQLSELFMEMQTVLQGEAPEAGTPADEEALGAQGIHFVMPINAVRWVVEGLVAQGKVTRGWLGVGVETRIEGAREAVYVSNVVLEGPADEGGLQVGDRIVAYLDEDIERLEILRRLTVRTPPGKKITLDVERNGERLRLAIVLGERP